MARLRPLFLLRTLVGWALGSLMTPASAFAAITAFGMGAGLSGALWVIGGFWAAGFAALAPAALAQVRSGAERMPVLGLAATAGPAAATLGMALFGPATTGTPEDSWLFAPPILAILATLALVALRVRGPGADWRALTLQALAISAAAHAAALAVAIVAFGADPAQAAASAAGAFLLGLAMVGLACGLPAAFVLRFVAGKP